MTGMTMTTGTTIGTTTTMMGMTIGTTMMTTAGTMTDPGGREKGRRKIF